MDSVLKQATEARKLGISLQNIQYCDQLSEQLLRHGKELEALYQVMQKLVACPDTSDKKFKKAVHLATEKMAWFEKSKAMGSQTILLSSLGPMPFVKSTTRNMLVDF